MATLGDDSATRTAKVLSLPTRAAILSHLLEDGPQDGQGDRRRLRDPPQRGPGPPRSDGRGRIPRLPRPGAATKGRPAKVYFTWEGEAGALAEAGRRHRGRAVADRADEVEVEVRVLERILADAQRPAPTHYES